MDYRILIVDDEENLVKGIKYNLELDNYSVDVSYDGEDALRKISENIYNLIILDIMLPKVDGLTLLKKIRERSSVPVIMLTAKGEDEDKVLGFEYGADDYLTKPFNILELRARIKALLRRTYDIVANKGDIIKSGDIMIDVPSRKVNIAGKPVDLTSKEFDILFLLVTNPGKIYSRDTLLEIIWGYDYYGDSRTVDVHIRRLREKIEKDPSNPQYVLTKWGVGYYYKG
ncbi:MAG: response regulator transcription factor [Caloramator sp.]|jgi:DNA-binding response OmpR family regulator|uniref:Stage 0 sporulation protein A homolog n=1 Tax=Caloramator proteoclasticus DSM 10124 TaxID=1121262 RepID=A0A1M5BBL5_9CLOT|nr:MULTISPECIES: response regulator transcription factor [Caloramator]MBZ4664586.1 response regulator transcription factor [Caloramator sp.]MCX7696055.1 response regulator transcription factor [Caloramator sp.]SHF39850.1 DNA-binding response regulator, OmpR family, contains REC and winged-helix (wHTH) domain [Caloramator proteoclasticus DSM 10124]